MPSNWSRHFFADHCWANTLLWRGSDRVGDWLDIDHHARHVHNVSEHHSSIGNDGISEDDWLLADLLSPYSFGHLLPRDCLVPPEEKGCRRDQSLGILRETPLADQEKNATVGHPCYYSSLYFLLFHNSIGTCLYINSKRETGLIYFRSVNYYAAL